MATARWGLIRVKMLCGHEAFARGKKQAEKLTKYQCADCRWEHSRSKILRPGQ